MTVMSAILLAFLTTPFGPVWAGAWLRSEGAGFAAISTERGLDGGYDHAGYVEYGVRDDLTLGAKVDVEMLGNQPIDGSGYLFLRRPLDLLENWQVSYALGLGLSWDPTDLSHLLRAGVSFGRGYNLGERSGWVNLDTDLVSDGITGRAVKVDGTVGINATDRLKPMMQTYVTIDDEGTSVTYAPSVVWSPQSGGVSYQAGIEHEEAETTVRIGIWLDF